MAPTTVEELRGLLVKHGLPVELAERAVAGLALVGGGAGRSKLGGHPEVPGSWPIHNGRGLTHLASIVLEELPTGQWRASLPEDGTVVFFADFSFDNEGWGPVDGTHPAIEIVHVRGGAAVAAATPPDEQRDAGEIPVVLNERLVQFVPVLTPPAEELYEALDMLDSPDAFLRELDMPTHLLLGEPGYLQGDPREPGELSLLQLDWDEELGFEYGDAGTISFWGSPEDIRSARWQHIKATPDSC
ncbi:uncharacterized protein YwqG [Solirubrobacter pauli]|uniref:Uncharacterized protein YwqG n=1 Tax=Solirubrobacter pauli TaxID=166793 RepID=A0A660L5R4_9ACTN|nr:DUF1963 domain-containing protein [Solirubrobacter pauli]RKQ88229.1 uncharacterized protein YwqG [Solirubrobacter pauli]